MYSELRDQILRGGFKPGDRLLIRQIAQEFGVSDIPVREGLRLLAQEGLVEYTPFSGAQVRQVEDAEIYEVLFIRAILEAALAQLSVSFIPDILFRRLDNMCAEMERLAQAGDAKSYAQANQEFHRTIYSVVPAKKLLEVLENLRAHHGWWSEMTAFRNPARRVESNAEHREIVRALRDRSMKDAGQLVFGHLQHARRAFLTAVRGRDAGSQPDGDFGVPSGTIIEAMELLGDMWEGAAWSGFDGPARHALVASGRLEP